MTDNGTSNEAMEPRRTVEDDETTDAAPRILAGQVHEILATWSVRIVEAVASGRAATRIARMATARASADLRKLSLPEGAGADPALEEAARAYLRRTIATVANASHEIERNRYSLQAMDGQLEKLSLLYRQICPEETEAGESDARESDGGTEGSVSRCGEPRR